MATEEVEAPGVPAFGAGLDLIDPLAEVTDDFDTELADATLSDGQEARLEGRRTLQEGQATRTEADSGLEAGKLTASALSAGRPVSLTQPSLRGDSGPEGILPPEELGLEVVQKPAAFARANGDPAEAPETNKVAAEPQADAGETAQRAPVERESAAPVQQARGEATPAAVEGVPRRDQAPPVQPKVGPVQPPPPPPSPEQAASVLRQFRLHLSPGMRQATIQLQPAALGRLAIRISLRNGQAHTEIRAESAEALEALERHVPELRAALQNQGIETGEIELSLGFGQEDSNSSERSGSQAGPHFTNDTEVAPTLASETLTRNLLSETGVDTYA